MLHATINITYKQHTIPEKTKEIYLKVISQGTHYDFYYSLKGEKDWTAWKRECRKKTF